jgi:hypothetical protein
VFHATTPVLVTVVPMLPVDGEVIRQEKITIKADETLVIYKGGGSATRK